MLLSHARVSGHVTLRNPRKIAKNDHIWPKIAILGNFAFKMSVFFTFTPLDGT